MTHGPTLGAMKGDVVIVSPPRRWARLPVLTVQWLVSYDEDCFAMLSGRSWSKGPLWPWCSRRRRGGHGRAGVTALFVSAYGEDMEPLLTLVPDRSFMSDRTRQLWRKLTGEPITEPSSGWLEYRRHVERRNAVVHGRPPCTIEEAHESIAVAKALITQVTASTKRTVET
jgi:hypothetical protein